MRIMVETEWCGAENAPAKIKPYSTARVYAIFYGLSTGFWLPSVLSNLLINQNWTNICVVQDLFELNVGLSFKWISYYGLVEHCENHCFYTYHLCNCYGEINSIRVRQLNSGNYSRRSLLLLRKDFRWIQKSDSVYWNIVKFYNNLWKNMFEVVLM